MDINIIDKHIPSTDGIHTLRGKIYIPEGEIRGLFQISHGMVEHIERYADFMKFLASHGFVAFGHDHLGHGKTAENKDELGYFAEKDGWKIVYRDVIAFAEAVKADFPEKPLILMGHSMGSFVARNAATEAKTLYDGLIFMGTGGPNLASGAGLALTAALMKTHGKMHRSKLVYALTFGSYNKRIKSKNPFAWLTHDEKLLEIHDGDDFCVFMFTVSAMHDLIKMQDVVNKAAWYEAMPKKTPILLISGGEDPVGGYGKGVKTVYQKLRAAGAEKVTLKLYPTMRHEVLNEIDRMTAYADILAFLKENF